MMLKRITWSALLLATAAVARAAALGGWEPKSSEVPIAVAPIAVVTSGAPLAATTSAFLPSAAPAPNGLGSALSVADQESGVLWDSASLRLVDDPSGNIYTYAPSVIVEGNTEHIWSCHNRDSGVIKDYVYYTKRVNGVVQSSTPVLEGSPGSWDAVHACDTSVLRSDVAYNGVTYRYVMFYLGNDLNCSCHNAIGIALAQNIEGPWIKLPQPLITYPDYTTNTSYWGVGQQSATSIDGKGRFVLFYRQDDSSGYRAMVRVIDISNLNNPDLGTPRQLTTNGWETTGQDSCCFINFDVAYDGASRRFYAVGEQYPFSDQSPLYVDTGLFIFSIDEASVYSGGGAWRLESSIEPDRTGSPRNHNAGWKRDQYGGLPPGGSASVIFTDSCANESVLHPCSGLPEWTYDLYELSGRIVPRFANVAQGKSAFASSEYSPTYAASIAVDGSPNVAGAGGWSPEISGTPWWEVDLGQAYSIDQIEVVSRQQFDQPETRRNFEIWASNQRVMSPGSYVVLGRQGSNSFDAGSTWTTAVSSATKFRYVAFVKTVPEYAFLAELRVHGRP